MSTTGVDNSQKGQPPPHDDTAHFASDLAHERGADGDTGLAVPAHGGVAERIRVAHEQASQARAESAAASVEDAPPPAIPARVDIFASSGVAVPASPGGTPDVAAPTPLRDASPAPVPPGVGRVENGNTTPPHPDKKDSNPQLPAVKGKRTRKPSKDEPPLLCEPAKVREAITAFRGFALEEAGEIINENKGIKGWCQKHTEEELTYVMARLPRDAFWGDSRKREFFRIKHFIDKASAYLANRKTDTVGKPLLNGQSTPAINGKPTDGNVTQFSIPLLPSREELKRMPV